MANKRDIAGLLTGIPSGGIDPRVNMTGREMLTQSALAGQQRMASGLRGMLGGGSTIQEKLVQAQGQQLRNMKIAEDRPLLGLIGWRLHRSLCLLRYSGCHQ